MSCGSSVSGGAVSGGYTAPTEPAFEAYSRFADSPADLVISSPILRLYEVETPDGNIIRVVDFGHLEASSTPGQVTFDGDEYTTIQVESTSIEEATDGSSPYISLSVLDYDRTILEWVYDNDGLRGAKVTLHIIKYNQIETPALAITRIFRVDGVNSLEGPARIEVILSAPAFRDFKTPHICLNRTRCFNDYPRRFTHDGYNYCPYPSDEFEEQTKQRFSADDDTETTFEHGWYGLNSGGPSFVGISDYGADEKKYLLLYRSLGTNNALWEDTTRDGPYLYKIIPEAYATDIDIAMRIRIVSDLNKDIMCGILIQSRDDPTSWIFWGIRHNSGAAQLFERVTASGVSYEVATTHSDNVLRIARSSSDPDDWNLYSASEDFTDYTWWEDDPTWTSRGVSGQPVTLDGDLNVGLVIGTWQTGETGTLDADIAYMRFLGGGYDSCDRSESACALRGATVAFNGCLGIPDGYVSW